MSKYQYILKGLDCANCANKIQEQLRKTPGLKNVNVNFSTLRLTYETENVSKEKVQEIVQEIEPDVTLIDIKQKSDLSNQKLIFELIRLVIGFLIAIAGIFIEIPVPIKVTVTLLGYSVLLFRTVKNALKLLISSRKINENLLITISTIGAYIVGKHMEGLMVITLYEIGKILESKAVNKTRKSISDLMDIRPEYANLKKNERTSIKVSPEEVNVGDIITVKHGEKIPLDGIIVSGSSILNTASLTGESMPVNVQTNDQVLSGSINEGEVFDVKVTAEYKDSTVSKILELVENATDKKAKTETFVDRASKIYTPIVLGLAVIVAVLLPIINKSITYSQSIYRALIFLVISCPCAIAISIPLCYFSGIGKSSKSGILVKGSNYIDAISRIKEIVFDKTGTLTSGKFSVVDIKQMNDAISKEEIIKYLAVGERNSNHPIAIAIMKYINNEYEDVSSSSYKEIPGKGIEYILDEKKIHIGFNKNNNEEDNLTSVSVSVNDEVIGMVLLEDSIKDGTKDAIRKLKKKGIITRIFTGDSESAARKVAADLEIENVNSRMLPADKYNELEKIIDSYKLTNSKVAFVGDGINDSPVLALADVGISMGGLGAHSAIEASDVVIMTDSIDKIDEAISISKKTNRIIKENLIFAILVKLLILVLSTIGLCGMGFAVFADVGVTLITIINTLRILK